MADFKVHLAGALCAGALCAGAALSLWGRAALPLAAASCVAGAVGGLLPDVDHDHAVPVREIFSLLGAVVPMLVVPALLAHGAGPEWGIVAFAGGYVLVRFVLAALFKKLTVHRGIFHSVPFLLCAGEAVALVLRTLPARDRIVLGVAVALGALVHLALDELYAVDFTGRRLKKSFGTALKLSAPSRVATAACYVALAALTLALARDLLPAAR